MIGQALSVCCGQTLFSHPVTYWVPCFDQKEGDYGVLGVGVVEVEVSSS